MKKTMISMLTLCALMTASTMWAQDTDAPRGKKPAARPDRYEVMAKELNLSDSQVEQLKAADAKFEAVKKESGKNMRAAGAERDSTVKAVLSSEQYTKMLEMRLQGRKMRHGGKKQFDGRPQLRGERPMPPCCPGDSTQCPPMMKEKAVKK